MGSMINSKRDALHYNFTHALLKIFECHQKDIEKILFEIKEIEEFCKSSKIDDICQATITINNKQKTLKFICHKTVNLTSIIAIDITKSNDTLLFENCLINLNKLIDSTSEMEVMRKTIDIFLNTTNFAASFIMINKDNILTPIVWDNKLPDHLECIKNVKIPLNIDSPALNTPVAKAYLKSTIEINDNTNTNPDIEVLKEEMLKRNYLSSVGIPIFKNELPYGAICICHTEINFFHKYRQLFKDLADIISYVFTIIEENRFKQIINKAVDLAFEWIILTDKTGKILYISDKTTTTIGHSKKELINKNIKLLVSDEIYNSINDKLKHRKNIEEVIPIKKRNKQSYILVKFIHYEEYMITVGKDITKEKNYEQLLKDAKERDELTGFLTKDAFMEKAKEIIAQNPDKNHILIKTDIHNFSYFNLKYGKRIGDLIFIEIANDLKNLISRYDNNIIIAKNDDGFLIFIEDVDNTQIVNLHNIIDYFFKKTYVIENLQLAINYNGGISIYPKDDNNIEKLIELANIALKESKQKGINSYEFYDHSIINKIQKEENALSLIEEALQNNYFKLFFQPHINTQTKKLIGAESLIRIKKDDKIISPNYFVEELEKSTYIKQVDIMILDKVDEIITKTDLKISFNLSLQSFNNRDIINKIIEIGQKHPKKLEVELLERTLIKDSEYSKQILAEFKKNNILIAMDDFGTGYSSLSYITKFPIDIIKIDISFVQKILDDEKDFKVVKTIINLSKELGMTTIAEGVETKEQYLVLKTLRCDIIQGFYFHKPMSEEEFLKIATKNTKG